MSKPTHVGAPKIFILDSMCRQINEAFGGYGCYLVGSSIERADWRDVDVRFIMEDEKFDELFPNAGDWWESDARWLLLNSSISEYISRITGLPVDFQIQPQSHANDKHKGPRYALGLRVRKPDDWKRKK